MNWDAIGAIAELLGGLGVMITLGFLALQIRHNAQAVQNETLAELNATMTARMMMFAQSGELAKILRSGLGSYSGLSQVDRFRFHLAISTILRHYETAFIAWKNGLLEKESWQGMETMLNEMLRGEGTRRYWEAQGHAYSEAFRAHVEGLLGRLCDLEEPAADAPSRKLPAPPKQRQTERGSLLRSGTARRRSRRCVEASG